VIFMAIPATKAVVSQKDTSTPTYHQGDGLPVALGLRVPQRRGQWHFDPVFAGQRTTHLV